MSLPIALRFEIEDLLYEYAAVYEQRYLRHLISGIRVMAQSDHGISVEAHYAVFETLVDAPDAHLQRWTVSAPHRLRGEASEICRDALHL
jgi:hypothetical protein